MPAVIIYKSHLTGHFIINPIGGGDSSIIMYNLRDSLVVGVYKSFGNGA